MLRLRPRMRMCAPAFVCVRVCVLVHVCQFTSVTSVCVFRVEAIQQVDGAGRSAAVVLLVVPRAHTVLVQLALSMPQMPGQP